MARHINASQAWNGYGYVEARVLSWTDPSGWAPPKQGFTLYSPTNGMSQGEIDAAHEVWKEILIELNSLQQHANQSIQNYNNVYNTLRASNSHYVQIMSAWIDRPRVFGPTPNTRSSAAGTMNVTIMCGEGPNSVGCPEDTGSESLAVSVPVSSRGIAGAFVDWARDISVGLYGGAAFGKGGKVTAEITFDGDVSVTGELVTGHGKFVGALVSFPILSKGKIDGLMQAVSFCAGSRYAACGSFTWDLSGDGWELDLSAGVGFGYMWDNTTIGYRKNFEPFE